MRLLKDTELISYIESSQPIIKGLEKSKDWLAKDSSIQSASLDLHIGDIYLPPTAKEKGGDEEHPLDEYTLMPGQTAFILTLEDFVLPSNITGIGFPPSRISCRGILMTNPGHIDPGYKGKMRFTVVNMGRNPFHLERGRMIVTVLLFELDGAPSRDWKERYKDLGPFPLQKHLDLLSHDFLDVNERATKIVKRFSWQTIAGSFLLALITVYVSLTLGYFKIIDSRINSRMAEFQSINEDVAVLKEKTNVSDINTRLEDFNKNLVKIDNRITELEGKIETSNLIGYLAEIKSTYRDLKSEIDRIKYRLSDRENHKK